MSVGTDNLKHVVVLMMENRSFDHMLGFAQRAQVGQSMGLPGTKPTRTPQEGWFKFRTTQITLAT